MFKSKTLVTVICCPFKIKMFTDFLNLTIEMHTIFERRVLCWTFQIFTLVVICKFSKNSYFSFILESTKVANGLNPAI